MHAASRLAKDVKKMNSGDELGRRAAALKGIYRKDGVELSEEDALAIAEQMGSRPFWSAVLCGILVLVLIVFLVLRFVI